MENQPGQPMGQPMPDRYSGPGPHPITGQPQAQAQPQVQRYPQQGARQMPQQGQPGVETVIEKNTEVIYQQGPQKTPIRKKTGVPLVLCVLSIFFSIVPILGVLLAILAIMLTFSHLRHSVSMKSYNGTLACGIAGLILSTILTTTLFIIGILAVVGYQGSFIQQTVDVIDDPITSQTSQFASSLNKEELEAYNAVDSYLSRIENQDSATIQHIGDLANENFELLLGLSMEDCGIDPNWYAKALTDKFTYEINTVVVDKNTKGKGVDFVLSEVSCYDIFSVITQFSATLSEYTDSTDNITESEFKQEAKKALEDAVASAPYLYDRIFSIDVVYDNGTWVVDEESWESELIYYFGRV